MIFTISDNRSNRKFSVAPLLTKEGWQTFRLTGWFSGLHLFDAFSLKSVNMAEKEVTL